MFIKRPLIIFKFITWNSKLIIFVARNISIYTTPTTALQFFIHSIIFPPHNSGKSPWLCVVQPRVPGPVSPPVPAPGPRTQVWRTISAWLWHDSSTVDQDRPTLGSRVLSRVPLRRYHGQWGVAKILLRHSSGTWRRGDVWQVAWLWPDHGDCHHVGCNGADHRC